MESTQRRMSRRRVAAGLAGALLATGALTGVATVTAAPAVASAPATSDQAARFEVDFLTGMIDHHHMAVMMSEVCVEKAVNAELVATCESIMTTQSAEIATMQQWLQDWYGLTHEPDMSGMQSMDRYQDLDAEEFEVAFLRSMIRHHWGAIREADRCLDSAEHGELVALCTGIRTAQLEEITQMQGWLEDWYGLPGGRPVRTA